LNRFSQRKVSKPTVWADRDLDYPSATRSWSRWGETSASKVLLIRERRSLWIYQWRR